jgi:large subunit ribosomal protein LP0
MGKTRDDKKAYFDKLTGCMSASRRSCRHAPADARPAAKYPSVLVRCPAQVVETNGSLTLAARAQVVNVDNVGSNQMHQIRQALRGKGQVLMGKNTMVRRGMRDALAEFPAYERLLPHVKGNIGFVFTSGDLKDVRDIILANKVAAPAKAGAFAPNNVFIPAGPTGMEPGKTSFFQALGIPTKIARGAIEIVSQVQILTAGGRVGQSEATLLNMLNISPFTYGMTVVQVFSDGACFAPAVLDIGEAELIAQFMSAVKTVAAISLATKFPTQASIMHSLVNGFKDLLAVSLATEYDFDLSEKLKERLANPEAFAAAAPAAAAEAAPAAAAEAPQEEEKEESDADMGFGLFD